MSETQPAPSGRLTAAAFAVGAVLTVVADVLTPHTGDGGGALVETVSGHSGSWMAGYAVQLLSVLPLLAGVVGLAAHVSARGRVLTRVGACVLGAGLVGLAAMSATELMLVPVATGPHDAAVAMASRMDQSAALVVVFLLALPGLLLGVPLLAFGLARAGRTTWVVAGLATVATVIGFVASGTVVSTVATVVLWGLLAAVAVGQLAPAGRRSPAVAEPATIAG